MRPWIWKALVACTAFWTFVANAEAQTSAEALRQQIIAQLSGLAAKYATKALPADTSYDRAARLVEIDPSQIALLDGRLTWLLKPRRKLTDEEQLAALADLEEWLRSALSHSGGPSPLAASQITALLAGSSLQLTSTPPARTPLSLDYSAGDTITRFVQSQAASGRLGGREFSQIRQYANLQPDELSAIALPGQVLCSLRLRQPYSRQLVRDEVNPLIRGSKTNWPQVGQVIDNYFYRKGINVEPLAEVFREALYLQPQENSPSPLLTKEEAAHVQIRIVAMLDPADTLPAGAAPGIREALPTAGRGSSNRYVGAFQIISPQRSATVTLHRERALLDEMGGPPRSEEPAPNLVLNQPGFLGAVINAVAFSPDGSRLAVAGDVLRIWNLSDEKLEQTIRVVPSSRSGGLSDVAWSPDGRYLIVAVTGQQASLRIFDTADYGRIADVLAGHEGFVDRLKFSPRGTVLATAGSDNRVYLWDWASRQTKSAIRLQNRIDTLAFADSPTGDLLAIDTSGNAAFVSSTDAANVPPNRSPLVQRLLNLRLPDGGRAHPYVIAFDGALGRLAVGGWSQIGSQYKYWCGLWSADKAEVQTQILHDYYLTACAFSPSGDRIATANGLGAVVISDAASGKELQRFEGRGKSVYAIEPDGPNVLLVGRTPRSGSDWQRNRYGKLESRFDLLQRSYLPLPDVRQPAEPALTAGDLQLEYIPVARNSYPQLAVRRGRSTIATLPFREAAGWHALGYQFLRSAKLGTANPIVVGMESGELSCFNPLNFLTVRTFSGHIDRVWNACESSDGGTLYSASGDGTIRAWPLGLPEPWGGLAAYTDSSGRVTHVIPNTPTARAGIKVSDRIFSINGMSLEQLGSAARHQEWPLKAGEVASVNVNEMYGQPTDVQLSNIGDLVHPLYSVFVSPDGRDWIIWTPQGYYDASPSAETWVGWEVDRGEFEPAEFLPLSQFRKKFHRPDLIDALIRTGRLPKNAEIPLVKPEPPILSPGGVTPLVPPVSVERIISSPPRVRVIEPAAAVVTGQSEITVRAEVRLKAEDQAAFGKPEIKILVNGHPAATPRSLQPVKEEVIEAESVWTIQQAILLEPAENTIAVVASTRTGRNDPAQASVKVVYRTQEQAKPLLDVLAIGVSKYKDPKINALDFTVADAQDFAAAVAKRGAGLHREVRTTILVNEEATTASCRAALGKLVQGEDFNRTVVIFLAAHGHLDKGGDYYLMTQDADSTDPFTTALPWTDLERTILRLQGCRVLLFADTCHSAALGLAVDPDRVHERSLADEDKGVFVFAACAARQRSYELAAVGHGLFTKAILDSLAASSAVNNPMTPKQDLYLWEFKGRVSASMRALCDHFMLTGKQDLYAHQSGMGKDFPLFRLGD